MHSQLSNEPAVPASLPHLHPFPCTWSVCKTPQQCGLLDVFQDTIEITGTFKHRKVTLVEEGFNPAVIKDALYFLDDKAATYVPMTEDIYNAIRAETVKL